MIAVIIAYLAIIVATFALMLANYWYTFGLWPRSWTAFILCALGHFILQMLLHGISKDKVNKK